MHLVLTEIERCGGSEHSSDSLDLLAVIGDRNKLKRVQRPPLSRIKTLAFPHVACWLSGKAKLL